MEGVTRTRGYIKEKRGEDGGGGKSVDYPAIFPAFCHTDGCCRWKLSTVFGGEQKNGGGRGEWRAMATSQRVPRESLYFLQILPRAFKFPTLSPFLALPLTTFNLLVQNSGWRSQLRELLSTLHTSIPKYKRREFSLAPNQPECKGRDLPLAATTPPVPGALTGFWGQQGEERSLCRGLFSCWGSGILAP